MRTARRGLILAMAIAAVLTVSVAALASVVDEICLAASAGDDVRRLGRELRIDATLDAELRQVRHTQAAKRQVLHELIAGRLTLSTAAERFRVISEEAAAYPLGALRKTYAGTCDAERWCKCVLQCARMEVRDRADSAGIINALEQELENLRGDGCDPA